jgi:hypothetical protein
MRPDAEGISGGMHQVDPEKGDSILADWSQGDKVAVPKADAARV